MKVHEFEKKINYKFKNKSLIDLAFTHSSYKNKTNTDYERLEFLGDRVLSLVLSEYLFLKYPKENEGALSKRLSNLVSKQTLLEVANEISIKEMLKINYSEKKNLKLKKNVSILSDVCEALIGAIYLDTSLDNAKEFIFKHWKKKVSKNITLKKLNTNQLYDTKVTKLSSIIAKPHLASSCGEGLDLFRSSVFHIIENSSYIFLSNIFNLDGYFFNKFLCSKISVIL